MEREREKERLREKEREKQKVSWIYDRNSRIKRLN